MIIKLACMRNNTFILQSLLNDKVFKEGYMGFGALLRKYLKDTHDYDSPEVINTLRNLAAPLQKMSDGLLSVDDEETVIASLKGLENGQYINSDIEDLIVQTIMNKDASQRTRAMALAVAKTFANYPKVRKNLNSLNLMFISHGIIFYTPTLSYNIIICLNLIFV